MPYRALISMIVTVGLALLAVSLWVGAVAPMLSESSALMQNAAPAPAGAQGTNPATQLRTLTRGVLLLAFVLIIILIVIGIFATVREWLRRKPVARKRVRTKFVDAWKIAGERLDEKTDDPDNPDEKKNQDLQ